MYDWEVEDPVFNTWVRLRQTWEAFQRALELELEVHQTTLPQIDILLILSASKTPLSPTEIANYVFREKHSTSGLLTRMEKAGYVRKSRSSKDQRTVKVRIQPKGEDLLKRAVGSTFGYARQIMVSSLATGEITQLDGLLKKLRDGAAEELGLGVEPLPQKVDKGQMLRRPK